MAQRWKSECRIAKFIKLDIDLGAFLMTKIKSINSNQLYIAQNAVWDN